jgi:hypothetical protein
VVQLVPKKGECGTRLTYLDGFSSRASLLKYIANTKIICDEFIFLEIGQYILGNRNNSRPKMKKKIKLTIFLITPFFGGTHDLFLLKSTKYKLLQ